MAAAGRRVRVSSSVGRRLLTKVTATAVQPGSAAEERDAHHKDWPTNVANSSFDEMERFYAKTVIRPDVDPKAFCVDVMTVVPAFVHVDDSFKALPKRAVGDMEPAAVVVDETNHAVSTLSWNDVDALKVMQDHTVGKYLLAKQPPAQAIVLDATRTVGDAAALLLRHKVEAVIITNKAGNAVGVVTRKGIFQTGGSEDDGFDVFQ